MNLPNVIMGVSLLLSLITIAVFIRYIIVWRAKIQNTYARLNKIEESINRYIDICSRQQEQVMYHQPPLPEKKPNSIELVRHYINLYYPALIENIVCHTGERLSSTDELLCMMIRLDCTNKEIGAILSIANGSVLTARYRLKRKLGLPQDQQLDTWIQSMGKGGVSS